MFVLGTGLCDKNIIAIIHNCVHTCVRACVCVPNNIISTPDADRVVDAAVCLENAVPRAVNKLIATLQQEKVASQNLHARE